ncbi:MAG: hypothetical protein U0791_03455 [Gemmataceae bacterium]
MGSNQKHWKRLTGKVHEKWGKIQERYGIDRERDLDEFARDWKI